MAKIALIFLVVFCIVQLSLAARIARDTPAAADSKPTIDTSGLEALLTKASDGFKDLLSEQNIQKAKDSLSQLGETIKETASNVRTKLHEATATKAD